MIDRYAVQDFANNVFNYVKENKRELSKRLTLFAGGFLLGVLLNSSCQPSSSALIKKLQEVPQDLHPTRTFYEDKVDKDGRPGQDGIIDMVLMYDQYGGRKEILPGYMDKNNQVSFKGREQD